jgi:hypothetical protein
MYRRASLEERLISTQHSFEINTNPYTSDEYIDGRGFGADIAGGQGMQEDAFKRFLDRNTMGIREYGVSDENLPRSPSSPFYEMNRVSYSVPSDHSSDNWDEHSDEELYLDDRGAQRIEPIRAANNSYRAPHAVAHKIHDPLGRLHQPRSHVYNTRDRKHWDYDDDLDYQGAYQNERNAYSDEEEWHSRRSDSYYQDDRVDDHIGGERRVERHPRMYNNHCGQQGAEPQWTPYHDSRPNTDPFSHDNNRSRIEPAHGQYSRDARRHGPARRPAVEELSEGETQPSHRSSRRGDKIEEATSHSSRRRRQGIFSTLKDALSGPSKRA